MKATTIILLLISLVGVASGVAIYCLGKERLETNDVRIARQLQHIAEADRKVSLDTVIEETSKTDLFPNKLRNELNSLQKEVPDLEKRIGALKAQLKENREVSPSTPANSLVTREDASLFKLHPQSRSPEYLEQLERAAVKRSELRLLTSAVRMFARANSGVFPDTLEQASPYLSGNREISDYRRYELVFEGSDEEIVGIPLGSIALIREREPWRAPSGKLARLYGMLGGNIEIVESDDNFRKWEAQRIVPPKTPAAE